MAHIVKRQSSCGRGVLKLRNWNPLPRPGQENNARQQQNTWTSSTHDNNIIHGQNTVGCSKTSNDSDAQIIDRNASAVARNGPSNKSKGTEPMSKPTKQLTKVLAKYSYKANPDRPGGFDELSIKQGEYIYFHGVNPTNPYWVKAENNQGVIGHVPAEYIMKLETKPSQLPWLENRRLQRETERKKEEQDGSKGFGVPAPGTLAPRKYVSAYNTEESTASSEYNCQICGKSFNGPKPYRLHMVSKAHKEEEEAQNYR